jgi:G3E family GTPase
LAETWPQITPVTLITGFLGSGKTTLLQRLLREPAFSNTAVLINELGEIALDHHLLERIDETMVVLKSGCLCCTIRGELAAAIRDLHEKRELALVPPFRHLVVESTGLADPFPILSTVQADPVLRHHFSLDKVVTTVDAVNGMQQLDEYPESVKQAAVASRIVVTKTDLAEAETVLPLVARLRRLNPIASLWYGADRALDAEGLLSAGPFGVAGKGTPNWFPTDRSPNADDDSHGAGHHPHGDIRAISLTFDMPIDWAMFSIWLTMLLHRHGNDVLRVKGILNVAGAETPVALHGVQHLIHPPSHLSAWPDADRRSQLVLIVKGLAPMAIDRSIRAICGIPSAKVMPSAAA